MVIVTKKGEVVKTSVVALRTQEKNTLLNGLLLKYSRKDVWQNIKQVLKSGTENNQIWTKDDRIYENKFRMDFKSEINVSYFMINVYLHFY